MPAAIVAAWNRLSARDRGFLTSTVIAVGIAVLTVLQQQIRTGTIDLTAAGVVGVLTFITALLQFLHGLGMPQE